MYLLPGEEIRPIVVNFGLTRMCYVYVQVMCSIFLDKIGIVFPIKFLYFIPFYSVCVLYAKWNNFESFNMELCFTF